MIIDRFVTVLADTAKAREIHFRIRYQVFCEETKFEDTERFPEGMERDSYDANAHHFIVWDRSERRWVGAMRLVDAGRTRLPSEDICPFPLIDLERYRPRIVEFSRLCILRDCRHTPSAVTFGLYRPEGSKSKDLIPVFYRQNDNEILLRLLYATFDWSQDNGFEFCYGIITPALSRILGRLGIPLTPVGDRIKHRGTRTPYRYKAREAKAGMANTLTSFARMTANSVGYVAYSDFMSGRTQANALAAESGLTRQQLSYAPVTPTDGIAHHAVAGGH